MDIFKVWVFIFWWKKFFLGERAKKVIKEGRKIYKCGGGWFWVGELNMRRVILFCAVEFID